MVILDNQYTLDEEADLVKRTANIELAASIPLPPSPYVGGI